MDKPSLATGTDSLIARSRRTALRDSLHLLLRPGAVLAACLVLALATRLLGLHTTITTDEHFWMQRTLRFGAALARGNFDSTYRSGHPGVTVMWVGLLGVGPDRLAPFLPERYTRHSILERAPGYLDAFEGARSAVAATTAVLAALIVALAWKLLGPGPGLVGGLLLLLDPYLVGSSRLLHVDALLAPLMTTSALAGLIYWTRGRRRPYLLLSGVAGGLALLTKAPAGYLAIYLSLVALVMTWPWCAGRWRRLLLVVLWGGIAAAVYGALWPALWTDPARRAGQVAEFALSVGSNPHEQPNFFLGHPLREDPGSLYYPVALAFRLGPVVLVGLLALLLGSWRRHTPAMPVLWLIVYVALFVGVMTLGAKKFDRYMLPAIMVLDVLAGVGLWRIAGRIRRRGLVAIALAVPLVAQSALLWWAYPYPLAAYNPMLGGAAGARQAILIGWGEGLEQAAAYLDALPGAERLVVASNYSNVVRPRFRGTTVPASAYLDARLGPEPAEPPYFVIYVNAVQRWQIPASVQRAMAAGPPEFTAFVHGAEYAWVYRVGPVAEWLTDVRPESDDDRED